MLKSMKTGVSTTKRVIFSEVLAVSGFCLGGVPLFFLVVALFCRSTCQFRRNREKSNNMLSATSHIGLEFLTKFLNMSKLQNRQTRLILVYHRVPLHHSSGFMHDVPVMRRDWKHPIIFVVNRETKLMLLGYSGTIMFC